MKNERKKKILLICVRENNSGVRDSYFTQMRNEIISKYHDNHNI